MCVEETGDRAAGGVAGDDKAAAGAGRVFLEEGAEAGGDGVDHCAGDFKEAAVAEVAFVIEEAGGGFGVGVPVYAPVAWGEEGGAADGEDDGVHVVDGDGCEDHSFGAEAGVGGDEGPCVGSGRGSREWSRQCYCIGRLGI